MTENTSLRPSADVTYPDRALTPVRLPVLPWTLLAAGVLRIRLRSVPPVNRSALPAIGSALYHVSNQGSERTEIIRLVSWSGGIRSKRDRPEPSDWRNVDALMPCAVAYALTAARPADQEPWPETLWPMAFVSASACPLFDSLRNGIIS